MLSRVCEKIRRFAPVLVLAMLFAGCADDGWRWDSQVYRVNKKDTLYAIAWRYGLDYRELARWNTIQPPYIIHPGQELILIDPDRLPLHRRPVPATKSAATPSTAKPSTSPSPRQTPPKPAPPVEQPPPEKFIWPAQGKVIATFQGSKSASQGIDIEGKPGDPVFAVADGRVVYSGSGLTGYGNLIIVKHNDSYLSAYAHNRRLLVKEGDNVKSGQRIAEMGLLDDKTPLLHFEIRKQGAPVDPLKYLPRR